MEPRVSQLHITDSKSVTEYAYHEDKNFPIRKSMEDNYIAVDDFLGEGSGFFGILDGHGGSEVSEHCKESLPLIFQDEIYKSKNDIKGAFERSLKKVDDQLKIVGASQSGTTCCLVYIRNNGNNKLVHVANLGDTRAVLCGNGVAKRISIDHKTSNESEQERIKKEGGLILKGRVGGQLAITRALGDLMLKTQGVSNIPDIQTFAVQANTQFLIVASDGLWDVCEDQKAVDLVRNMKTTKEMAKQLLQYALKNNSQDNVSVLILKFNK